jgi:hypothetical protein
MIYGIFAASAVSMKTGNIISIIVLVKSIDQAGTYVGASC